MSTSLDTPVDPASLQWVAHDQVKTKLPKDYLPVDIALLLPGPCRGFDLCEQMNQTMRLFCSHDYVMERGALNSLRKKGKTTLMVPVWQGEALVHYVEMALHEVMKDTTVSLDRRSRILYSSISAITAEVMANPKARSVLRRSVSLVSATAQFLSSSHDALGCISALFSKEQHTHVHAVNSSVLGMAMFNHLISPKSKLLNRFGLAMLLLDIGKSSVGATMLNKPGRLTEEEFQQMKAHPTVGWEILRMHGLKDGLIREAVLFHHEKLDGSGYPLGISGSDIQPVSRVAAIIDIFDALTTDRPHRPAMNSQLAIDLMTSEMTPHQLDGKYLSVLEWLIPRQLREQEYCL